MAKKSPTAAKAKAKANAKAGDANDASAGSAKPPSPAKAKAKATSSSSSSSSSMMFLVLPVLVALVGGLYTMYGVPPAGLEHAVVAPVVNRSEPSTLAPVTVEAPSAAEPSSAASNVPEERTPSTEKEIESRRLDSGSDTKYPSLHNKYASEIVQMTTQKLLTPSPADHACPAFEILGDLTHVEHAMAKGAEQLRKENAVFLMLNGENEGVFVASWQAADGCLRELAQLAAERLGADVDVLRNGVKLMTQMGLPITSAEQLDGDAGRIAHVLLDFQIWVWPGIKVGHVFEVEGSTVTTLSMRPRVFSVEGFFDSDEAEEIMRQGIDRLERSPVDSPDAVDGYHADRTSFTAFLHDNQFTRDFRARTAKLARLPSPSFVERLQLVRYETGQFFRKHEDYFDSKHFLPKKEMAGQDYKAWAAWAASKVRELVASGANVPAAFQEGGDMFPNAEDLVTFQHSLLGAFVEDAHEVNFFKEHADLEWGKWIVDNLANKANDILSPLLRDKGYMLPHIIKAWEKRIGLPEAKYQMPKRPVSGVTHYFRWIRWVKERVQDLLDEDPSQVPEEFHPTGAAYPTYNIAFQNILVNYVLEDFSEEQLTSQFGAEWVKWLVENKESKDVLWEALKVTSDIFDFVAQAFAKRAGPKFAYDKPKFLQHFEPNRFVTVFLYLNECPEGGETVFPYSKERLVTGIERAGMAECSEGLAVPPTRLTAAMFYAQTPENFPDPASLHGGCPPARGIKYGSNSFAWNADADEGANAWDLGADLKANPSA
ncbi:hypothetical protein P43SY_008559 [Pythium insidiosum]|uniref:Prolyl 4-hydroxylase alpha subunit domain-containing protein n=1 Tax=Pythium insidiosum TaxID=114742 RepID=A0AAD5Q733_PYTIN|nr:hypothetical protein P43SY_008559 [Pythium insidiosum]